jgi:polyvinyl alcohol dehydrogenase (cytochrome)
MKRFLHYMTGVVFLAAVVIAVETNHFSLQGAASPTDTWNLAGQNLENWRSQPSENIISPGNVATLTTKWTFTTGGDVSATPTVTADTLYFPDWTGSLYAVDRNSGNLKWSHQISEYNGHQGSIARVSPAVHKKDVIIGDVISGTLTHDGANIIAVRQDTGKMHWITSVDSHPAAIITGSPVVHGDIVYVGVSSNEEGLAADATYPCCSFRGSIVALEASTGQILWKRYTLPDNHGLTEGYSGNAVWQPPAIDAKRGSLYIGTGNNYEVPDAVKTCLSTATPATESACFATDDYFDTALSLDLLTGRIKWSRRLQGIDIWTVACEKNPNPVSCPLPSSPDYDLGGSGPNLFPHMVGFGQKSGMYWALNPTDGSVVWSSMVGPGATLGGIEWGTATDGNRIYVAISNADKKPYPLLDGETITWGAWTALDVSNGRIIWQTGDPDQSMAIGSVSVANGVLYAPSFSGNFHAIDATSGKILWSFMSGGSVIDGPSIVNGVVYWGSGYKKIAPGTPNNKVFAFQLSDQD